MLPADDARLEQLAREHQPHARHVTFGVAPELDPEHAMSRSSASAGADVRLVGYDAESTPAAGSTLDAFGERTQLVLAPRRPPRRDRCVRRARRRHAAGASIDQALAGLARARPPAMRGEIVELGGRKVIVDCYNANPASMAAALRTLAERARGQPAVAVVGDMLELGDHAPGRAPRGRRTRQAARPPRDRPRRARRDRGRGRRRRRASSPRDPADAAERALARTEPGDWILLKASRGMRLERVLDAMKEQTL